jgi:tRNA (5-methylaminomethyl-2-thiouridylate)-methyltransferase
LTYGTVIMEIAALVSGGVDSSVALALLKEQGYNPTAFFLKVWSEEDFGFGDCPWEVDQSFVFKTCHLLGIKAQVLAMQREYWDLVIAYTLEQIKKGCTPNPDIMCNKLFKFGAFYHRCGREFDKIATGHYARTSLSPDGRYHLLVSQDRRKDQTYFLSQISQSQLAKIMFPVGDYEKGKVRELAAKFKLPNADRKDSQGICFLGKINFRDFIKRHLGEKTGPILEWSSNNKIGDHRGFWFYTIGQRFGLDLAGGPWFVVEKNTEENIIYVSRGYDPESLYQSTITLSHLNWISQPPASLDPDTQIQFKIRHTPEFLNGSLQWQADQAIITSAERVRGVAKGQFGVIYYQGECLGGGVIS